LEGIVIFDGSSLASNDELSDIDHVILGTDNEDFVFTRKMDFFDDDFFFDRFSFPVNPAEIGGLVFLLKNEIRDDVIVCLQ